MLKLLSKRAKYLSKTKLRKASQVEQKLTQIKNEEFEEMVTPIYFYCTFMEAEGVQEATHRGKLRFMRDYSIDLQSARSPSDLLWYNRDVSRRSARISGIFIAAIVVAMATVCGYLFSYELSMQLYINFRIDPPTQNCHQLFVQYTEDELQQMAAYEYFFNQYILNRENNDWKNRFARDGISETGALPCFCNREKKQGASAD